MYCALTPLATLLGLDIGLISWQLNWPNWTGPVFAGQEMKEVVGFAASG